MQAFSAPAEGWEILRSSSWTGRREQYSGTGQGKSRARRTMVALAESCDQWGRRHRRTGAQRSGARNRQVLGAAATGWPYGRPSGRRAADTHGHPGAEPPWCSAPGEHIHNQTCTPAQPGMCDAMHRPNCTYMPPAPMPAACSTVLAFLGGRPSDKENHPFRRFGSSAQSDQAQVGKPSSKSCFIS